MRIDVLTLFPAAFAGPLDVSIIGRARTAGILALHLHDIREHATDRHRRVDDYPFGGGQGMVMRVDVLDRALQHVQSASAAPARVVYLSPQGKLLDDGLVRELAREPRLILVCGRYEGVDERFVEHLVDDEISIGDYILTGGELPAMVLIDAVARHLPGALGDDASPVDESFAGGLLEHPQYTRPPEYRGWRVPAVLLGGNHAEIERWKAEQRVERTRVRRPDLLTAANAVLAPLRRARRLKGLTVREGGRDDLEAVRALWDASEPWQLPDEADPVVTLADGLATGRLILTVVEHRGRLVAAALSGFDGRQGYLYHLAAAASARGTGAGAAALEGAEEALGERGCRWTNALVPADNFEAMAFFERHDWERWDVLTYAKALRPTAQASDSASSSTA